MKQYHQHTNPHLLGALLYLNYYISLNFESKHL